MKLLLISVTLACETTIDRWYGSLYKKFENGAPTKISHIGVFTREDENEYCTTDILNKKDCFTRKG